MAISIGHEYIRHNYIGHNYTSITIQALAAQRALEAEKAELRATITALER